MIVVEIKSLSKIQKLKNITVLFEFDKTFIGEMQFKIGEYPDNYHANHFVYEIARSKMLIEVL